jgi:uncharacterized membrane protein YraQ (UPF0718 family)
MFELICALVIGLVFGFLLKKEKQPPIVEILQNQVEFYEKELKYYKNLCKWHAERKDAFFEDGRQQGMKQERALWKLSESSQEIGYE